MKLNQTMKVRKEQQDETKIKPVYEDGLRYIAGWMARKMRKLYPKFTESKHYSIGSKSWIQDLSRGGLTEPTEDFFTQIKHLERIFLKCSSKMTGSTKVVGVKRFLTRRMMEESTSTPKEVIDLFVRRRIAIRLKHLNKQEKENTNLKFKKKLRKVQT